MIRVKDAEKSLKFYQDVMGMSLVRTHEAQAAGFNLYFLAYPGTQGLPKDGQTSHREGLLELTWNYGTEKDENFKYHSGNDEPQGFGHICKCPPMWASRRGACRANLLCRRVGRRPRCRLPAVRGPEMHLEEEAYGRADEECRIPAGSRRVLD